MGPDTFKRFYSSITVSLNPYRYVKVCRVPLQLALHISILPLNCLSRFRFVLVNAGVTYLYFSNFQQIDEEEFGGVWELTKEGFMTSFAGFLVI